MAEVMLAGSSITSSHMVTPGTPPAPRLLGYQYAGAVCTCGYIFTVTTEGIVPCPNCARSWVLVSKLQEVFP